MVAMMSRTSRFQSKGVIFSLQPIGP